MATYKTPEELRAWSRSFANKSNIIKRWEYNYIDPEEEKLKEELSKKAEEEATTAVVPNADDTNNKNVEFDDSPLNCDGVSHEDTLELDKDFDYTPLEINTNTNQNNVSQNENNSSDVDASALASSIIAKGNASTSNISELFSLDSSTIDEMNSKFPTTKEQLTQAKEPSGVRK